MDKFAGAFTQWAVAFGRFTEIFTDGHWWTMGDYMENVGKTTKRLLKKCIPVYQRRWISRRNAWFVTRSIRICKADQVSWKTI